MNAASLGLLLVVISTALEGFGQVCLKKFALLRHYRWVAAGIASLGLEAVLYTRALGLLHVGLAYAVSSLSLVAILLLSSWMLGERLTARRWTGMAFILVGVVLLTVRAR